MDPLRTDRSLVEWHRRLAIAGACLVFGLVGIALGSGRVARRLVGRLALATFVVAGYLALFSWGCVQAIRLNLPAVVGAWLANVAFALLALTLLVAQRRRRHRLTDETSSS